jgi:hypothetical protein
MSNKIMLRVIVKLVAGSAVGVGKQNELNSEGSYFQLQF